MIHKLMSAILAFRLPIICVWSAVLLIFGYVAITQTEFTSDYRVYFAPDNPELLAYEAIERDFASDDNILIAVAPQSGDVFTPDVLAVVAQLTEAAWQIPHAQRVDSLTNFQHVRAVDGDIVVGSLIEDPRTMSPGELTAAREISLNEPTLVRRLISETGQATGIFVTLNFPGDDHRAHVPETVGYARSLVDEIRREYPDLRIALTGTAIISHALDEMTVRDLMVLSPILYVVLFGMLAVFLRSVSGMFVTSVIVTVAAVVAMGVAASLGILLTSGSVVAPIIILTLAVADSVHFIASAQDARHGGMEKVDALRESMRINFEPVFLTSLTTLIGFLSLNFSAAPPFRDLGNVTAAGVTIAWAASITLLPAMLSYLPLPSSGRSPVGARAMARFADFVVTARWPILITASFVAALFTVLAPLNRLDDQVIEWFGERTAIRQDTEFVTEVLTGPYRMDFAVDAESEGGVADPAYLRDLDAFATWLQAQPEVQHVDSFTDVLRRLNRAFNDDDERFYRLPESRELAAQYILLYEFSLPYGLDLTTQLSFDKSASRLTVTMGRISSAETRALKRRAEAWAAASLSHAEISQGSGTAVMFAFVSERTINSMLAGTGLAFLLIALTLFLALRSWRLSLLSLIPNVLPVVIAFGIWALTVSQIGVVASAIAAMTLGLVVDDTVHFLSKYHRARKEHSLNVHDGIRFAFEHVGGALVTTTLVLVAGFSVMTLSDFLINWQMGVLTVITITVALVLDFLLLPALLMFFDREKFCNCATCRTKLVMNA